MSQPDSISTSSPRPDQPPSEYPAAASEWDTDTDVMPPETSRQLLRISRQLEQDR
jgi:hypothetical protein